MENRANDIKSYTQIKIKRTMINEDNTYDEYEVLNKDIIYDKVKSLNRADIIMKMDLLNTDLNNNESIISIELDLMTGKVFYEITDLNEPIPEIEATVTVCYKIKNDNIIWNEDILKDIDSLYEKGYI